MSTFSIYVMANKGFKIIVARLLNYGQISFCCCCCCCCFLGIFIARGELTITSVVIAFLVPDSFISVLSLSASNCFYALLFFLHSSPINFRKPRPSPDVSLLVPSSLVHSCIPSGLRDTYICVCLPPSPSTFPPAVAPVVTPIIAKANCLVDFALCN